MKKSILDLWQQATIISPNLDSLKDILGIFVHEPVFHSLHGFFGIKQEFDIDAAFDQIAIKHEGGSCRMMNLAAKKLLLKVGYKQVDCIATELVHVHETSVEKGTGVHMSMIVTLAEPGSLPHRYLFDPGNGNGPRVPIPFNGEIIKDVLTSYRIIFEDHEQKYALQAFYKTWITQFRFTINDVMEGERLATYLKFVGEDTHFYRNNIYVLKCFPGGFMQIYNEIFRIRQNNGEIQQDNVLNLGGVKRLLLEKFGLPETFVDACTTEKAFVKPSAKPLLDKLWQPHKVSPKIGKMIFHGPGLTQEEPHAEETNQRSQFTRSFV